MKKIIAMGILFTFGIASLMVPALTYAEGTYNQFSIAAIIPENQINRKVSYFDLRVTPNQTQELQIQINNTGNKLMTANLEINAARTGNNGVKIYTDKGDRDASMTYSIEDIAEVMTPEVQVQPNSTSLATIKLQVPDADIPGIVLGGIVVKATTEEEEETKSDQTSYDIKSQVAYALGLKLSMKDEPIPPNLNLKKVEAKLTDYHPTIVAQIQNDQSIIMNNVKIQGEVYKKGFLKEDSKVMIENGEISPNTNFDVIFDWQDKKVKAGTYKIHLKAEYKGDVWEWNENFQVKTKEAKIINDKSMFIKEEPTWIWIVFISIIVVLLIAVFILLFLTMKRRKQDKEK